MPAFDGFRVLPGRRGAAKMTQFQRSKFRWRLIPVKKPKKNKAESLVSKYRVILIRYRWLRVTAPKILSSQDLTAKSTRI
ncbi:hypothetical protein [Rhizobium sp. Root482]|uniref:hypothetical protein n=1 Tax=Rhizobium sp. Root482 TaxID=1736543 RepID=UPI0012E3C0BF|nr:hypothetical protein [Rhizobium sp. Root482]